MQSNQDTESHANMAICQKRKQKDIMKLLVSNYKVDQSRENVHEFTVEFHGPKESFYEGGKWNVLVSLPLQYPYKSPSIGFKNKIFHPNIDEASGAVCLDVINQTWSPMFELVNVFDQFLPQLLLYPNPKSPLNAEAAALITHSEEKFKQMVQVYVQKYAFLQPVEKSLSINTINNGSQFQTQQKATRPHSQSTQFDPSQLNQENVQKSAEKQKMNFRKASEQSYPLMQSGMHLQKFSSNKEGQSLYQANNSSIPFVRYSSVQQDGSDGMFSQYVNDEIVEQQMSQQHQEIQSEQIMMVEGFDNNHTNQKDPLSNDIIQSQEVEKDIDIQDHIEEEEMSNPSDVSELSQTSQISLVDLIKNKTTYQDRLRQKQSLTKTLDLNKNKAISHKKPQYAEEQISYSKNEELFNFENSDFIQIGAAQYGKRQYQELKDFVSKIHLPWVQMMEKIVDKRIKYHLIPVIREQKLQREKLEQFGTKLKQFETKLEQFETKLEQFEDAQKLQGEAIQDIRGMVIELLNNKKQ